MFLVPCRSLFVLVVVQVIDGQPPRPLSDYTLQQLREATRQYRRSQRVKRQTGTGERVYIAANLTESDLASNFTLGDGGNYSDYINHQLEPGMEYRVGLWSQVDGTDTPVLNSAQQRICKSQDVWNLPV